ncbi:MAG: DUF4091 domain-containing protein [Clostridiaceae bacterium]|nr:DUF4091 domain-containing protein [Clostridiaceae bacterium]
MRRNNYIKKLCLLLLPVLLVSVFLYSCNKEFDPTKDYKPIIAEHEDSTLKLTFVHSFTKVAQDEKPKGNNSYYIRLAKNEIEGCQFILYSENAKENLTAEITEFKNEAGDAIPAELFIEHYISTGDEMTPDPLVPLSSEFNLEGSKSQAFYIKIKTTPDTPAGIYEAMLSIKDGSKTIKQAKVFAKVWDFTLSEETACTTAMDLSHWAVYVKHEQWDSDDNELYKIYYDYLLENRINAYYLPYDLLDPRVDEYLDNPRVTSFCITGYKTNFNFDKLRAIHEKLSQKEEWFDKGYFYYVDEPTDIHLLNEIEFYGMNLETVYPGYKMVAPFFTDIMVDYKTDQIEFMSKYIRIWCNKPYAYKTAKENKKEPKYIVQSEKYDKQYGTYAERMEEFKKRGDKVWWYVCWEPQDPYANILMEQKGVVHRVLFWQQKQFNVDGFLYYAVNNWTENPWEDAITGKHLMPHVYGDGVLIYDGAHVGIRGPIGSLRLEAVRDGIEDFEYLTMAEKELGKKKTNKIIKKVSKSILDYTKDDETFVKARIELGNKLEKALKK